MIMLDDNTALVYNTNDLREAVDSDNGVEYVYFGADITLEYGITIYPHKPSLTLDGTYLGVRYTFTDILNGGTGGTIGIRSVSSISVTIKNINIIGRNYYGIPFVTFGTGYSNVSTIYDNVTYTGTQINYNAYGYTRFTDCTITVDNNEVAEANRIELSGNCTLIKTNELHAVFWLRGSSSLKPSVRVLEGANVTITTALYFIYEENTPDIIIEPGASLSLTTKIGMGLDAGHTMNSFLVDTNAAFSYTQTANGGRPSLYMDGALTVNEGASFYMQGYTANQHCLIRFTGSAGRLNINNPKSFVLYNSGSASAKTFNFASTIPIVISGGQVNYWDTAVPFPDAGTLDDVAPRRWYRPGYGQFTLRGTAGASLTTITENDFTPEELADLPQLTLLQLHTAQVLSVGSVALTVYSVALPRIVSGLTESYANVRAIFMPSHYRDPHTTTAGDDGLFELEPTTPVPYSEYAEVFSNTPFLIVSQIKQAFEDDKLFISYAPYEIGFPVKPIQEFTGEVILPRDSENTDLIVKVVDTRATKTDWVLWVNIDGPLKTDEDDTLDDAVVFVITGDDIRTVRTDLQPIYNGESFPMDEDKVEWPENRGLLARISVPIRSGKRYATRLGWAVAPEGEIPGEDG